MKPSLLLVVGSDPRVSPRPVEAVRIAAGVGVWEKAEVNLYLRNSAVLLLGETPGALVAEEELGRYWPIVAESGRPVYVQAGSAFLAATGRPPCLYRETTDRQLAELAAQSSYVLSF